MPPIRGSYVVAPVSFPLPPSPPTLPTPNMFEPSTALRAQVLLGGAGGEFHYPHHRRRLLHCLDRHEHTVDPEFGRPALVWVGVVWHYWGDFPLPLFTEEALVFSVATTRHDYFLDLDQPGYPRTPEARGPLDRVVDGNLDE